jgi:hypothetical protein
VKPSGRSAAWLARLVRDQEVEGSNPFAPTTLFNHLHTISGLSSTALLANLPLTLSVKLELPEQSARSYCGGKISQIARLYRSPVGAVSLITTVVPLKSVGALRI